MSFNWAAFIEKTHLTKVFAEGVEEGGACINPVREGEIYEINFAARDATQPYASIMGAPDWQVKRTGKLMEDVYCHRFIPYVPKVGDRYFNGETGLIVTCETPPLEYNPHFIPLAFVKKPPIRILSKGVVENTPTNVANTFEKLMGV